MEMQGMACAQRAYDGELLEEICWSKFDKTTDTIFFIKRFAKQDERMADRFLDTEMCGHYPNGIPAIMCLAAKLYVSDKEQAINIFGNRLFEEFAIMAEDSFEPSRIDAGCI